MIDIVIVNYNTSQMVIDSIESFYYKLRIPFNIYLVDNNSDISNFNLIKQYSEDKKLIKIIRLNENIGYGRANNEAFLLSNSPYVYLLNPDTIIVDDAIEKLYQYLSENDDVGIVGSNLYDNEMNPMHSFYRELPSIKMERKNSSLIYRLIRKMTNRARTDFNYSDIPMEVGFVTGASLMLNRIVLDQVGFFDKDFFMYSEEAELSYRIKKVGYKIINVPTSKVIHLEGASFNYNKHNINYKKLDMLNYGRLLYQEKTQQNPIKYGKAYMRLQRKKAIISLLMWNKRKWYQFKADYKSMANQIKIWNQKDES